MHDKWHGFSISWRLGKRVLDLHLVVVNNINNEKLLAPNTFRNRYCQILTTSRVYKYLPTCVVKSHLLLIQQHSANKNKCVHLYITIIIIVVIPIYLFTHIPIA